MPARRLRVAVLFGGRSGEHPVSCISAASVLRALDRTRYDVQPIGILPDGRWVLAADDAALLEPRGRELPMVAGDGAPVAMVATGWVELAAPGVPHGVDVVFPLLHGPFGEDGTIQGLLETVGIPYVGSGVFASAAAMDKQHMKALLAAAGLPIGDYRVLTPGAPLDAPGGPPWFVKPARGGSSLGITRVMDRALLAAAVEAAREHDPKVLIESAVPGREIECAVLDGHPPEASVPAEIRVAGGRDFYDFEAKYLDPQTAFDIPAALDPATTARVQELALRAFRALDCAGLARVDLFVAGDGSVVINEVNTMPGFTPASMFPRMWAASGVDYSALVDRLIALALERGTGLH